MTTVSRRTVLAATAAGFAAPWLSRSAVAAAITAFVDDYRTNTTADLTADTNAAVRILSGVQSYWRTGSAWNNGTVLAPAVLRANMRFCETRTASRTEVEGRRAFVVDRQHQSYAVIAGLGPLADAYRAGALAVTGITEAPDTTPPTTVSDTLPAGAPPGSALGAGSPTSALGQVVTLVNTVRGSWSSSNPSKLAVQYPRPWRMTTDSEVAETGAVDEFGYPVYRSKVSVVRQLLRQRSPAPADDGGFPSGHTNALHLAALALAYAVPERFQELVTCAFDLADTRITAGMHSPIDVIGGRILATALAAAILNDPANAALKASARAQALAYFQGRTSPGAVAHAPAPGAADPYGDRAANRRMVLPRLTYILPRTGPDRPMTVPKGAEVLLETRHPYLTADQRRAVLRTTALPGGYALLDGPEQWGRLDLFRAADGYGAFEAGVDVTLDTADTWRNDITGPGGLTVRGAGALTLTGANRFRGGVDIHGGVLTAGSATALGSGDVTVHGGALRLGENTTIRGALRLGPGATLTVPAGTALSVAGAALLGGTLDVVSAPAPESATGEGAGRRDHDGDLVAVVRAGRMRGRFARVTVAGRAAEAVYTRTAVLVRAATA